MVTDTERPPDVPPVTGDEPPKRRRRTRAEMEAGTSKSEPKTRLERYTRYVDIKEWVTSVNTFAATVPALAGDVLSSYILSVRQPNGQTVETFVDEIERLSVAFDRFQASSPKVHKYTEKFLESSPGVALLVVAMGLVLPRLEAHGLLPWVKRRAEPEPAAYTPESANRQNEQNGYHGDGVAVGAAPWQNEET